MRASLRTRLTVALAGIAVTAIAITAVGSVGSLRVYAASQARADLLRIARAVAQEDAVLGEPQPLTVNFLRRVLRVNGDDISVIGAGGRVSGTNPDIDALAASLAVAVARGEERTGEWEQGGRRYVYVAIPNPRQARAPSLQRKRVVGIVIARPVRLTREAFAPLARRLLGSAAVAVVLAVGAAALLARRLLGPIRAVSDAADRVARGDHSRPVPVSSRDELGSLAASFNEMTEALDEARRREREFLANVSHELRTPVTAIKGYAEALADGTAAHPDQMANAVAIIRSEADRLERMVTDVMDLARLGSKEFAFAIAEQDVAEVLTGVGELLGPAAGAAGIALETRIPPSLPARTDADRLTQIVSNLVDNALRVTPAGGTVAIDAHALAGEIEIIVSDTGPGIAPEDLPHVFERSYLWRASRDKQAVGTGLGLAIVRDLATAMGGSVSADSTPGSGSRFTVRLPAV